MNENAPEAHAAIKLETNEFEHSLLYPNLYYSIETRQDALVAKFTLCFKTHISALDILYSPEHAIKEGLGMVKTMKESIEKLEIGSKLRRDVWDRELSSLQDLSSPKTLIAVCGATGAGKSSILNAILDDNIVPTSGMRACTSVVTELSYHTKSTIDADIFFLSELEWREELAVLLHDLVDEDGNLKRISDLKSDTGVAWQKVHAVYPKIGQNDLTKMSIDQILAHNEEILNVFGTCTTISAEDSKLFRREIGIYIDSKDQNRIKINKEDKSKKDSEMIDVDPPAFWPLIRQVNIRCHAAALSTGAILVDLPGVADVNAARNNIAKEYMKKCNCFWILAPITRAVDDKTARDLLGDAFKMQLMNGNYDDRAITFIASKCDDISCSEVINALHLENHRDLEEIELRLNAAGSDLSLFKKNQKEAKKIVKKIDTELKCYKKQISEDKKRLDDMRDGSSSPKQSQNNKKRKNSSGEKQGSSKRRRGSDAESNYDYSDGFNSSSDESDTDDDSDSDKESGEEDTSGITAEFLTKKIKGSKDLIKTTRKKLNKARTELKLATKNLTSLNKSLAQVQREKNAFCSLMRSDFSRGVLKEDFRAGLKELDDAVAEERDPENFDPNCNLRDYDVIDLPVFTCSSRDYVRLTGQVKGDGEPSCFSDLEDTGIPEVRGWCHQLTLSSRERVAKMLLSQINIFAQSVLSYIDGIGNVGERDRELLREKWGSRGLDQMEGYNDILKKEDPLNAILGELGSSLGDGLMDSQATGLTPKLCTEFAKLVDKCVQDIQQIFKDGLEDKCRIGASKASETALTTLDEFADSMHWASYRAALRRHGCYRNRDLNVEFVNPFTRSIAHSWSEVFESDLFGSFQHATLAVIASIVKDIEISASKGLKDRAELQGELCLEEARIGLTKVVDDVKEAMNREQKEVSRSMAPHVQEQLVKGYDKAAEERGRGSVARQKAMFRQYVDECKCHIFEDGVDTVFNRLTEVSHAIGETLDEALSNLAQKIEVCLAVLWEGGHDNRAQGKSRGAIIDIMRTIQTQVGLWTEAEKMKREEQITPI